MNETPQSGDSMATIEQGVGYTFVDRSKLQLALTHRSFNGSENSSNLNNQRLEFLGDAVLQLVITHELFARYPEHEEGPLTKARAQLVNRRTLADLAKTIGLGPQLLMSRGEELSGGRERLSALADAFEALIGAVYLDSGFETTREFILQRFSDHFGKLEILPSLDNPKGELQELLQTSSNRPPHYELINVRDRITIAFLNVPLSTITQNWEEAVARVKSRLNSMRPSKHLKNSKARLGKAPSHHNEFK